MTPILLGGISTDVKIHDFSMCLRPNTDKIYVRYSFEKIDKIIMCFLLHVYGGNLEHLDDFTADGRKKSQRIYCISIIRCSPKVIVVKLCLSIEIFHGFRINIISIEFALFHGHVSEIYS